MSRRLPDAFIAHCNRRCPFGTGREQHLGGDSLFFRVEVLVHIGILGTFFSFRYRSFNATENGHDVFNWDDIQQIIRLKIDWYRILWMKQNLVILEYWKIEIPLDLDADLNNTSCNCGNLGLIRKNDSATRLLPRSVLSNQNSLPQRFNIIVHVYSPTTTHKFYRDKTV